MLAPPHLWKVKDFWRGVSAPTPVEGQGFLANLAPRLQLLEVEQVDQEVFLHYRLQRSTD